MKIDPTRIVRDHLVTLRDARTGKISYFDFFLFFAIPALASIASYLNCLRVEKDAYNVSITFFGIFIALLLNIQVAIFAILQRRQSLPDDAKLGKLHEQESETRRRLIGELNANLSYLVLFCCTALTIFLVFYVWKSAGRFAPAIAVFIYAHFLLTLLMVVKRAHALFQREYQKP